MILGIDPGLSGALAVYDPHQNRVLDAWNVPTLQIKRNGKVKSQVNIHGLLAMLRGAAAAHPGISAALELVGAMPGQGVSSMFSFGRTDGIIECAVAAAGIPYSRVTPGAWKKALGVPADKEGALLRAGQLMPESVECWTPVRGERDKQNCIGIAEAALIAYYGAKNLS